MCGIVGYVDASGRGSGESLQSTLRAMSDSLAHRGPDDEGIWCDVEAGIGFGHRRLSIVDVSPLGHQPMASPSDRYRITFNGEIYNHRELRRDLEAEYVKFRGHSDTEVFLAAIDCWGLDATLARSVGMFAFGLWDQQQRTLSLARDRMGEKPLYYGRVGTSFVFGSELKALRSQPDWCGAIDRGALTLLMRHNYIPAPWSIYEGIYKLWPGCVLQLPLEAVRKNTTISPFEDELANSSIAPRRYWSAQKSPDASGVSSGPVLSATDAIDRLEELLMTSVGQQMVADVPLGALLSGGIDSSVIVSLMQAQSSRAVKTYSIGFHESDYNEAQQAKAVAAHLGTDHTELYVTPQEAMDVIPKLSTMYDEPFSDSSQIPTYLVSQLARQSVTVSLSGDGGDELFGGYNRYFWGTSLWRKLKWMPRALRRAAGRGITTVSPRAWQGVFDALSPLIATKYRLPNAGDKAHKLAEIMSVQSSRDLYYLLISHWKQPTELVKGGFEPDTVIRTEVAAGSDIDFASWMMHIDRISYLPDDILTKVDRASMAVSLEVRVPMLDHRLVEFARDLPLPMKLRDGQGKWLLRQLLYRHVPRELIDRPKMGFGVPIDAWLRGPLREWAEDLLTEQRLVQDGYFHAPQIRQKWSEHLDGSRNWQYYLWDVLMVQAWLENERCEAR